MINVNYFQYLFKNLRLNIGFELPEEIFLLILIDKRRESFSFRFFEFDDWFLPLYLGLVGSFYRFFRLLPRGNFLRFVDFEMRQIHFLDKLFSGQKECFLGIGLQFWFAPDLIEHLCADESVLLIFVELGVGDVLAIGVQPGDVAGDFLE